MRIATGGIIHETSTCVNTETTLNDFEHDRGIIRGDAILERFRGANAPTGGFIAAAEQYGFELVPLLRASAFPGGLIRRADYEVMKMELIERLKAAGPVDGVLLDLHGAMVVDGIDDGDGDVIAAVRDVVGPHVPIGVPQDLHGNHSKWRVEVADAIVGYDTFPHIDMAERGQEAGEIVVRTIRGEIRPTMAIRQLPMFWSTRCQITAQPPMTEVIQRLHDMERREGVVSMTVATGFPWADVLEVGSSVIAVTNNDRALAQQLANELGDWIWDHRERWYSPPLTVRDALADGKRIGRYPIILADHADNTGGGSPGDSTEVLRTFLEMGLTDALALYMVDPEVAKQAHAAGVGSRISIRLGGKSSPVQGAPIEGEAEVIALSEGAFAYDGPMFAGLTGSMGTSAWVKIEGVSVVVVCSREQPFDQAFARSLGIDCAKMRYICVKSAAHFRAAFEPIAGSIYNVDAAGIHTHDFSKIPHTKRTRRIFPVEIPPGS
ncbi:MAG: M81 family metallopeptidase [Planctomycetaceae bacterium]|nr:M81 family metallopeptidase [Planctomycetales bacterium]MCB9920657.1 M81 family metallopeptidase [Planctomycetaceae bacterium]